MNICKHMHGYAREVYKLIANNDILCIKTNIVEQ